MRKRFLAALCALVLIASAGFCLKTAYGSDIITDSQIASIKTHCLDTQATLNRLQQSDILLRTDRGELYRAIADKLMVPLNQRIASNQLDGSKLVAITADYNTTYTKFYNAYRGYAQALSSAMSIDCNKQPTQFYDAIVIAHDKRAALHTISQQLVGLATGYKKQFTTFRTATLKENAS